jgi:nucleoside-diphosphate-sugar epimerase
MLSTGARVLRGVGVPLPVDADQVRMSARPVLFDTHKARAELFEPVISLEQSIRDTYQWYVERGVLAAR